MIVGTPYRVDEVTYSSRVTEPVSLEVDNAYDPPV